MNTREWIARNLAAALLSGKWNRRNCAERARKLLGRPHREHRQKLLRKVSAIAVDYPPAIDWLTDFLLQAPEFDRAVAHIIQRPERLHCVLTPARFAPAEKFAQLDIPKLTSAGDLATWLGLSHEHLDWFADTRCQHARTSIPDLQNYNYAFCLKKSGSVRLIEEPKPRLKTIQRRILHAILNRVAVHPSAHGFVPGRSCVTAAGCHCGEAVLLTADLKDYFLSVSIARVHGLFRALGYPSNVARLLTVLCTTSTPTFVFTSRRDDRLRDWATRKLYGSPHLAQGAPTSPALANIVSYSFDRRVSRLAALFEVTYTRYADDISFSGEMRFGLKAGGFLQRVEMIAMDEGFALNAAKTRLAHQSQRQLVTGIVVNEHVNLPREAFDMLKALLHNCRVHGPHSQNTDCVANFKEHVRGRIAWASNLNARRGAKLLAMFNQIEWN